MVVGLMDVEQWLDRMLAEVRSGIGRINSLEKRYRVRSRETLHLRSDGGEGQG